MTLVDKRADWNKWEKTRDKNFIDGEEIMQDMMTSIIE